MSLQTGFNNSFYGVSNANSATNTTVLVRVDRVILGPFRPNGLEDIDFKNNRRWASIGAITFTPVLDNLKIAKGQNLIARPANANLKQYPIVGEIVQLIQGPSDKMNDSPSERELFYLPAYNLWNNSHHNVFPNLITYSKSAARPDVSYKDVRNGIAKGSAKPTQVALGLGDTFKQKADLRNLQPFEGDLTIEGRWGHSIRFGSTTLKSNIKNPWSSQGADGDPIVIIRNGQGKQDTSIVGPVEPWIPVVEDINTDGASIYLCSTQAIVLNDLANFIPVMRSFNAQVQATESQIQERRNTPVSTDNISPQKQSEYQLRQLTSGR